MRNLKFEMRSIYFLTTILAFSFIANAQTEINSSTFGMMEARSMGPATMSGRITAIDGVAADQFLINIVKV